ncbi:MAG: 16S rRNA (cytosine(1402)-N(4))-methyltransferase RsmH [Gammaproteobacteria bacterium]|nr:16S rRNA (cytosine(1402)-N(4))-methyltransferase RsmH [Gammaproteobacteria bacterium]MDH4315167.1 16S rRNA (cytosine(1402)-N(4))-methyltransferase RsmH [Gammaproteobacteria bacterium]MDH5213620.1 16S rRNA (cytosine(1402)-N(4))-methyltransferase RsmH [Gammaproteobacteria bacterium]
MSDKTGPAGSHVPVLLGPVLQGLNIRDNGCYVDGTFGRGGHSREILRLLGSEGRLLAIDRDAQAVAAADPGMRSDPRFEIIKDEIAHLKNIAAERGLLGKVDGLLLDLGVSSPQLDEAGRGFSFRSDGPLDMRMDPASGISAADWLARVEEKSLKKVIAEFGEEKFAGRIARAIIATRDSNAILRTGQLAELVASVVPPGKKRIHPATKTFQAIRIFINGELEQLDAALAASLDLLASGGRLCAISFHSLEDRLVKRFIRNASREPEQYRGMPSIPEAFRPPMKPIGKAVMASAGEIAANPRARSARLRIAERV